MEYRAPTPCGLKPKDLIGIPWRAALALQSDGWYLRSDIVWSKPNAMPESVTDRPTRAHEFIFLLAKSERYYYDHQAVKEPCAPSTLPRYARGRSTTHKWADGGPGGQTIAKVSRKDLHGQTYSRHRSSIPGGQSLQANPDGMRSKRTVWSVATKPYRGAHFAVFPEDLIEPCVLAGSPIGGTVLDPFCGSGTTGVVALRHGRSFIGIDINAGYLTLARERMGLNPVNEVA